MRLRSVHPGVTVDEVAAATGFELAAVRRRRARVPPADRRRAAPAPRGQGLDPAGTREREVPEPLAGFEQVEEGLGLGDGAADVDVALLPAVATVMGEEELHRAVGDVADDADGGVVGRAPPDPEGERSAAALTSMLVKAAVGKRPRTWWLPSTASGGSCP